MSITVTQEGKVVLSKVRGTLPPKSIAKANEIFGEGNYEVVRGGVTSNAQTSGIKGLNGHHSEARAIQYLGDEASGARQATTHYACPTCETRQIGMDVQNITGTKTATGKITRQIGGN